MGSWKNFLQMLAAADRELFPEGFKDRFLSPLTKKTPHPDIAQGFAGLRRLSDQDVFAAPTLTEPTPCTPLEFLDAAVSYRNLFAGHGTHELPDSAIRFAPLFMKGAVALCTHLNTLWIACPVYVAKQAKLYGWTFFRLTPLVEAEGIGELQAAAPDMEEDRLYICFGDKKHPEVESLYPAALWEEEDILFANGTKGLIDIHYIGYVSQRSFETSIYEEDYRSFIQPFALPEKTEKPAAITTSSISMSTVTKQMPKVNPILISAIACVLFFIAGFALYSRFTSPKQQINSIAVLAFRNISDDPNQEHLCEGIAETIIKKMSPIEGLNITSPTSAFSFKNKNATIAEIGRELNVEFVLEGSIQKEGDKIRITARVSKVRNGYQIWFNNYDSIWGDIFSIQDEISEAIVKEMKGKLVKEEKYTIEKRDTDDTVAYNLYLLGRHYWNMRTVEGHEKAFDYFQQAIKKDPSYALAYVGLADIYLTFWIKSFEPDASTRRNIVYRLLEKALEIDSTCADAFVSLASNDESNWNFSDSEKHFKRALELNPNNAQAHQWYHDNLWKKGKQKEAFDEITRAQALDPLNPLISSIIMNNYHFLGEDDKAFEQFKKTVHLNPNYGMNFVWVSYIYQDLGNYAEAINTYKKGAQLVGANPSIVEERLGYLYAANGENDKAEQILLTLKNRIPPPLLSIAKIYISLGNQGKAQDILTEMIKRNTANELPSCDIAEIYLRMGNIEKSFEWYFKAVDEREMRSAGSGEYFMELRPIWEPIRSHPKYEELRKKMGLL
jgi:TolB-like protein/Flp pilus assembly protein TadD